MSNHNSQIMQILENINKLVTLCALLLLLTLAGCAIVSHEEVVQKELDNSAEQFVGKSVDNLLLVKGSPDSKETLSSGDMMWGYRKQKTGSPKGYGLYIGEPDNTPETWYEITNFIIGNDKIVKRFSTSVD